MEEDGLGRNEWDSGGDWKASKWLRPDIKLYWRPNLSLVNFLFRCKAMTESTKTEPLRALTNFLDGGEHQSKLKELAYTLIRRDKALYNPRPFDMTEREAREFSVGQLARVVEIGQKMDHEFWETVVRVMGSYDQSFEFRSGVHYGLFVNAIMTQGTPAQIENWVTKALYVLFNLVAFCVSRCGVCLLTGYSQERSVDRLFRDDGAWPFIRAEGVGNHVDVCA